MHSQHSTAAGPTRTGDEAMIATVAAERDVVGEVKFR